MRNADNSERRYFPDINIAEGDDGRHPPEGLFAHHRHFRPTRDPTCERQVQDKVNNRPPASTAPDGA
jgi:hypothetical protein